MDAKVPDRDGSQDEDGGQADAAVETEKQIYQGAPSPGPVLLIDGEGEEIEQDRNRDRWDIGAEGQQQRLGVVEGVGVAVVPEGSDDRTRDDDRVAEDERRRQPIRRQEQQLAVALGTWARGRLGVR